MRSLLFQGATPFEEPPDCAAIPCRTEVPVNIRQNGRIYRFVLRDKIEVEDSYIILVKAAAFAVAQGEPYAGKVPDRTVRDFLIKDSLVI